MLNFTGNKWRSFSVLLVLSFLLTGLVTPSQAETAGTVVTGSVLDIDSNPVVTVVTLDQIQSDSTVKVIDQQTTALDGSFSFTDVPLSQTYQISTKPSPTPNLTTAARNAILHSAPFTVDDVGLIFDADQNPIEGISIVQASVLELVSTVTDSSGSPISGAVATITQDECTSVSDQPAPSASAKANAEGVVTFYAPESGNYCLQISDPTGMNAKTSDSFQVTIPADGTEPSSSAIGDYVLEPAGNVQVKVVSSTTGKAISGAVVTGEFGEVGDMTTVSAFSSSTGIAILRGIPDQTSVAITVAGPPGSSYINNTTSADVIGGETVLCNPPANGDTEGVVPLDSGYPISGTVRDGLGAVIRGVTVDVQLVDETGIESPVTILTTNASGAYSTNGLAPGTYNLHFSDTTSDLSQYRENVDLNDLVMAEKAITNQNVVLRSCGVISGAITDENGDLLTSARLSLRNMYGDEISAQDVDQETAGFSFTKILPGKYSLKITSPGFRDKFVNNINVIANVTYSLPAEDSTLASGSGVTGRLVDTNAVPVINAQVAIFSASGNGFLPLETTTTNSEGSFGFTNLTVGTYRLKFMSGSESFPAFDSFWYGDDQSNADSFATAGDIVTELGVVATDVNPVPVTPWASVTGNLTNGFDDGENPVALEGATVTLVTLAGDKVESGLTDAEGNFTLYAPAGNYRLEISASGVTTSYLGLDPEGNGITTLVPGDALLISFADGMVSFLGSEPSTSGSLPPADVSVGGGTLSVSVVFGTDPVTEGEVTIYDANGQEIAWVDVTDDNDAFVVSGLAKGVKSAPYRLSYELKGQYSKTFYGGATTLASAKAVVVTNGLKTALKIVAVPLPSLDLELKASSSAAYSKKVSVFVYELSEGEWLLSDDLSTEGTINSTTKTLSIKVSAGAQYRIRVVPDESRIAAVWLGTKPGALSIAEASTITIPATGTVPKQTVLLNTPAIDVRSILTNSFEVDSVPTDIREVTVTLTGTIAGTDTVLAVDEIQSLGAGEIVGSLFDHIPTSYFPLTITATSADAVANQVVLDSSDLSAAQVAHPDYIEAELSFDSVVEPAELSGVLTDADGVPASDIVVNLVTDDGEIVASATTDVDGNYSFTDIPLGLHLTITLENSDAYLKPADSGTALDFTAQSGDVLVIDLEQHVAALYSGFAFDPDLNPIAGAQINIWKYTDAGFNPKSKPDFVIYSNQDGSWTFDGKNSGADVGDYVFQIDGNNSTSAPAFYAPTEAGCESADLSCTSTSADDAQPLSTSADSRVYEGINLVLQTPDTAAPTGVKWVSQPAPFGTAIPSWTWTGSDDTDGTDLETQYVISTTSSTATTTGAWSTLTSLTATTLKIAKPLAGTTYCLSIRMVDKSNNASSFITPSCATVPLDDAKLVPTNKKYWVKIKAKDAYVGAFSRATKTSKSATLTAKGYSGVSICVLYTKDSKMGTFGITQGKTKKGKIITTAGTHKAGQSVCVPSVVKATDVVSIVVQKPGYGVQIDGFAILPKAPSRPTAP